MTRDDIRLAGRRMEVVVEVMCMEGWGIDRQAINIQICDMESDKIMVI